MKTLIIYEEVPESTSMYIVDATEDEFEFLKLCNGNYINAVDCVNVEYALDQLNLRLSNPEDTSNIQWAEEVAAITVLGKWHGCKVDSTEYINPAHHSIEAIIITGFIL